MPCGWLWVVGTCCHFFPLQITFPLQMRKYEGIHDVIHTHTHIYDIMNERERERFFSGSVVGERGFEVGIRKTDMSPLVPPQSAAVF